MSNDKIIEDLSKVISPEIIAEAKRKLDRFGKNPIFQKYGNRIRDIFFQAMVEVNNAQSDFFDEAAHDAVFNYDDLIHLSFTEIYNALNKCHYSTGAELGFMYKMDSESAVKHHASMVEGLLVLASYKIPGEIADMVEAETKALRQLGLNRDGTKKT